MITEYTKDQQESQEPNHAWDTPCEIVLQSRIPQAALTQAEAKNVLIESLDKNKALDFYERAAVSHALWALDHEITRGVRHAIEDGGLLFWAEVFGGKGSRCEYSQGGFCTLHCGDPDSMARRDDCGYCVWWYEECGGAVCGGAVSRHPICIKTAAAMRPEEPSAAAGQGMTRKEVADTITAYFHEHVADMTGKEGIAFAEAMVRLQADADGALMAEEYGRQGGP